MSAISMKITETTIEGNYVHTNIQEVSESPGFLCKDSLSTIRPSQLFSKNNKKQSRLLSCAFFTL